MKRRAATNGRWERRSPWALLVAVLLTAAACGGDGEPGATPVPAPSPAQSPEPSPEPRPSPEPEPEEPNLAAVRVRLARVAMLEQPLGMATREGDEALYFGQKTGQVVALRDGSVETILDLSGEVSQGSEQGLLGLDFSPDGARLYVNYTDGGGDTHVTEFAMRRDRPAADSRRDLLVVEQPFENHNGGNLVFGPDGFLYVGLGDGGSAGDPDGNAQNLGTLLGKMLRIDPRPRGDRSYRIPPDNPFVGREGARPEIWAFGLRNPWRYSFDRATDDLWIGDVGQNDREEIDFQPSSSGGEENYGWDRLEGTMPFEGEAPPDAVAPVHDYGRDLGGTVIGGYVYRGERIPELRGAYIFGDLFNPELRALAPGPRDPEVRGLDVRVQTLVSFGEDAQGELYAISLEGGVFRLAPG